MKNKDVGWLIVGISAVIFGIVYLFNYGLKKIVTDTCSHGSTCSMYDTISIQTWISLFIAILIFVIGLFFVLSKENTKIIFKKAPKKRIDTKNLSQTEKQVVELLKKENAIFQATLQEKLGIGKVGITRLLDKLEAKQIIERKRRGMNNVVVLKQ